MKCSLELTETLKGNWDPSTHIQQWFPQFFKFSCLVPCRETVTSRHSFSALETPAHVFTIQWEGFRRDVIPIVIIRTFNETSEPVRAEQQLPQLCMLRFVIRIRSLGWSSLIFPVCMEKADCSFVSTHFRGRPQIKSARINEIAKLRGSFRVKHCS